MLHHTILIPRTTNLPSLPSHTSQPCVSWSYTTSNEDPFKKSLVNSDYNGCADIPRKSHKSRVYDVYGGRPPEDIVRLQLSLRAPAWTLDGPQETQQLPYDEDNFKTSLMSAEYDGGTDVTTESASYDCCPDNHQMPHMIVAQIHHQ